MKKDKRLNVVWEHEPDPTAEDRLLKAFEMLLSDASICEAEQERVKAPFDKNSLKDNHGACQ